MTLLVAAQYRILEQDEQVMGDGANAEKDGVGFKLSAGHAPHRAVRDER